MDTSLETFTETSSSHYLALSAQQKNEIIRSNIEQDTQPDVWPSLLQLPGLFVEKVHAIIMDNKNSLKDSLKLLTLENTSLNGRKLWC